MEDKGLLLENKKLRTLERIAHAVEFLARKADPAFKPLAKAKKLVLIQKGRAGKGSVYRAAQRTGTGG